MLLGSQGRIIEVSIQQKLDTETSNTSTDTSALILKGGGRLDELNISCRIIKNISGTPNVTQIDIFNLAEDTKNKIERGLAIIVSAGYETDPTLEMVSVGAIVSINTINDPAIPDVKTTITSISNFEGLSYGIFSKSYQGVKALKNIIDDVAKTTPGLNVDINNITINKSTGSKGLTIFGTPKNILDNLALNWGFSWNIHNKIFYAREDLDTNQDNITMLSSDTGLKSVNKKIDGDIGIVNGLTIKTIALLGLKPYDILQVDSVMNPKLSGKCKATNILHILETKASLWETTIECLYTIDEIEKFNK